MRANNFSFEKAVTLSKWQSDKQWKKYTKREENEKEKERWDNKAIKWLKREQGLSQPSPKFDLNCLSGAY